MVHHLRLNHSLHQKSVCASIENVFLSMKNLPCSLPALSLLVLFFTLLAESCLRPMWQDLLKRGSLALYCLQLVHSPMLILCTNSIFSKHLRTKSVQDKSKNATKICSISMMILCQQWIQYQLIQVYHFFVVKIKRLTILQDIHEIIFKKIILHNTTQALMMTQLVLIKVQKPVTTNIQEILHFSKSLLADIVFIIYDYL
mmetsp:Transcript_20275/g.30120  ORF Transcript_20275/g.30120 Transcript_20275/m.30120 type:complete len:200 (+) Transcript_20275:520-1119(+)